MFYLNTRYRDTAETIARLDTPSAVRFITRKLDLLEAARVTSYKEFDQLAEFRKFSTPAKKLQERNKHVRHAEEKLLKTFGFNRKDFLKNAALFLKDYNPERYLKLLDQAVADSRNFTHRELLDQELDSKSLETYFDRYKTSIDHAIDHTLTEYGTDAKTYFQLTLNHYRDKHGDAKYYKLIKAMLDVSEENGRQMFLNSNSHFKFRPTELIAYENEFIKHTQQEAFARHGLELKSVKLDYLNYLRENYPGSYHDEIRELLKKSEESSIKDFYQNLTDGEKTFTEISETFDSLYSYIHSRKLELLQSLNLTEKDSRLLIIKFTSINLFNSTQTSVEEHLIKSCTESFCPEEGESLEETQKTIQSLKEDNPARYFGFICSKLAENRKRLKHKATSHHAKSIEGFHYRQRKDLIQAEDAILSKFNISRQEFYSEAFAFLRDKKPNSEYCLLISTLLENSRREGLEKFLLHSAEKRLSPADYSLALDQSIQGIQREAARSFGLNPDTIEKDYYKFLPGEDVSKFNTEIQRLLTNAIERSRESFYQNLDSGKLKFSTIKEVRKNEMKFCETAKKQALSKIGINIAGLTYSAANPAAKTSYYHCFIAPSETIFTARYLLESLPHELNRSS